MSLAGSRVLLVGAGGLGCAAALALAKEGVARLTIADPDKVDVTNLHRQPWHRSSDVGRLKVESAADGLRGAFPELEVQLIARAIDHENAVALFTGVDVVIDATDGVATKFLLSDAAVLTGVPLIHGGALQLEGQVMAIGRRGPCLRCLFEAPPPPEAVPTCAQAGVLGSLVGVVGALQVLTARELLKPRDVLGRLRSFDARTMRMREVTVKKDPECGACAEPEKVKLVPVKEMACALP